MLHLTFKGIWGRKKESALLAVVLFLSFLFSAMLAVLLPSIEAGMQAQREDAYGSWQVLLAGEDADTLTAVADAAAGCGAQTVIVRTVGHTSAGENVSTADEALWDMGHFQLTEGRLPENAGEVLIVENQFRPAKQLAAGDTVQIQYEWQADSADAQESYAAGRALVENCIRQGIGEQYETLFAEFSAYWNGGGYKSEAFRRLDPALRQPLDRLTAQQQDIVLREWAEKYKNDFAHPYSTTYENILYGYEGLDLLAEQVTETCYLRGKGFGSMSEQIVVTGHNYSRLIVKGVYTVCGVIKAYESAWDGGGQDLPDAFLHPDGAKAVCGALDMVREKLPLLQLHEAADTLLAGGAESAAALYETLAARYLDGRQPRYEVEDAVRILGGTGAHGGVDLSGIGQVVLSGINADGEPAHLNGYSYGDSYVFPLNGTETVTVRPEELDDPALRIGDLQPIPPQLPDVRALYQKNEAPFRINTYAFPDETASVTGSVSTLLNGMLTMMTAAAVLVICLVQNKRRVRSLILLKSIGQTNRQAAVMQLAEALLFLLPTLLLGLPLGALAAKLQLQGLGYGEVLALDSRFLFISLTGGVAATLAGLEIPLLYAMRMPLTGKRAPVGDGGAASRHTVPLKEKYAYLRLEKAAQQFNRRRDRMARLLQCAVLLVMLATLLLSHNAYRNYRTQVLRTDKPDYVITVPYGMSSRYLQETAAALSGQDGVLPRTERVDAYLAAENVRLNCSDHPESALLSALTANAEDPTVLSVTVAGLERDSEMLARLLTECPEVDPMQLIDGEGCILMVPNYRQTASGRLTVSFDAGDEPSFRKDAAIAPGDTVRLAADTHIIGEGIITETNERTVRVLAVLHYFPEEGVWPFALSESRYAVISGSELVRALYPHASNRLSADQTRWMLLMQKIHCGDCDGKTYFNIYAGDGEDLSAQYWNYTQNNNYDLYNFYKEKQDLAAVCARQRMLVVLLGAACSLLLVIILLFILSDLAEQSRRRVGILRAIGVANRRLQAGQTLLAAGSSLRSVLLANVVLAAVCLVTTALASGGQALLPGVLLRTLRAGLLWQYPWRLHGALCLGFWAVMTVLQLLPYRRFGRQSIIETVKGADVE